MILGNGSDELIDLLIRSFCEPAEDNIVVFSPGYAMYEVSAAINRVGVKKIDLTADLLPDWSELRRRVDDRTKLIFLCTPNNPTGKVIPYGQIERLCGEFQGMVIVDEAYIDFIPECRCFADSVESLGNGRIAFGDRLSRSGSSRNIESGESSL